MSESRLHKSYLNARVNVFFYLVTLFISFFSRKIFLEKLGADFVGLTSTMQNLLGFLNLAELGIGASIGYVLYKPIFDGNRDRIKEIVSVLAYLYRNVGLLILGAGLLLTCFLPYIFADAGICLGVIYFCLFCILGRCSRIVPVRWLDFRTISGASVQGSHEFVHCCYGLGR